MNKWRFVMGITIFVVGQATTLLIPLVTSSNLSPAIKATLSGILLFVTPQPETFELN